MSADRQRLIDLIVTNLHFLVRQPMTREEAIKLKQQALQPLGLLDSQYGLVSSAKAKEIVRRNRVEMIVEVK